MDTPEPIARQIALALGHGILQDKERRSYELCLRELQPVRPRAGWWRFALALGAPGGQPSQSPLIVGIISGGGRGVMPWLEGRLFPIVLAADGQPFDAREEGIEAELIALIGRLLPPGGHLMLEYESPGQSATHRELLLRVPPAATHLGELMFRAGFRGVFKDWYISEGGNEGPRKLQANKSPNPAAADAAMRSNMEELRLFLKRQPPRGAEDAAVITQAQMRARQLLRDFGPSTSRRNSARRQHRRLR